MYALGAGSKRELAGVYPIMVRSVERGIQLTTQDFTVHDGLRTLAEQKEYVARGVSRTLKSMHIAQPDGYGHAVDLVPYINGKLRWEWPAIYKIAEAMHTAFCAEDLLVRWGGVWDRIFNDLEADHLEEEVRMYVARMKARRPDRDVFIDGPHFEVYSPLNPKWGKIQRV